MEDLPFQILIVEDNDADASLFSKMMAQGGAPGLALHRAISVEDAKQQLQQGAFHAMLVDLGLPGCEGMDAVLGLQADAPATPIVVLTGAEGSEILRLSMEAGAQDCLLKHQLSPQQVMRCLASAMQRHRLKMELWAQADRLRRSNTRLFRLSHIDALTKVYNRRGFQRLLSAETRRARRDKLPLVAMLADMDGFKEINDFYTHAAGDLALAAVGACLKQVVGSQGHVGRVGGDEFMVLLKKGGLSEAWRLAERFKETLSLKRLQLGGRSLPALSASLGAVEIPRSELRLTEIMRLCHEPLKHDKQKIALR